MENNLKIWISYHDDKLIDAFNLVNDDIHNLFGTHKQVKGVNLNYLSRVLNEAVTMYYVWKNNIYSEFVGFESYRRRFNRIYNLSLDECQVYDYYDHNIKSDYYQYHDQKDYDLILQIIKNKYGIDHKYYKYLNSNLDQLFIPNEIYIMSWENFDKLCKFIFDIFFEFNKQINGQLDPLKYEERYAESLDPKKSMRAFYMERLISCWIVNNFNIDKIIK